MLKIYLTLGKVIQQKQDTGRQIVSFFIFRVYATILFILYFFKYYFFINIFINNI
jgi:hypothetical protein